MAERICALCGQEARGFASVWTAETGQRWYCHPNTGPDCYTEARWEEAGKGQAIETIHVTGESNDTP